MYCIEYYEPIFSSPTSPTANMYIPNTMTTSCYGRSNIYTMIMFLYMFYAQHGCMCECIKFSYHVLIVRKYYTYVTLVMTNVIYTCIYDMSRQCFVWNALKKKGKIAITFFWNYIHLVWSFVVIRYEKWFCLPA